MDHLCGIIAKPMVSWGTFSIVLRFMIKKIHHAVGLIVLGPLAESYNLDDQLSIVRNAKDNLISSIFMGSQSLIFNNQGLFSWHLKQSM